MNIKDCFATERPAKGYDMKQKTTKKASTKKASTKKTPAKRLNILTEAIKLCSDEVENHKDKDDWYAALESHDM